MTAKKKKIIKGLVAVALIAIIGVGATLALLSANTGNKTNKFSSSGKNITGETTETFHETSYAPGQHFDKNPSIKIGANSSDCYAALALDYYGDNGYTITQNTEGIGIGQFTNTCLTNSEFDASKVSTGAKISETVLQQNYATVEGWNKVDTYTGTENSATNGNWVLIASSTNGSSKLYMYNGVIKSSTDDISLKSLFTGVTTTKYDIKSESYTSTDPKEATTYKTTITQPTNDIEGSSLQANLYGKQAEPIVYEYQAQIPIPQFVIDINGYAVQATGLTTNDESKNDADNGLARAKAAALKLIDQAGGSSKYKPADWVTAE